jgi:hypothetical protein
VAAKGLAICQKLREWAADEYGRRPWQPDYQDKAQLDREWATAQKAKLAWAVKREGRSLARDHDDFNDGNDRIMRKELAKYHADRDSKKSVQPNAMPHKDIA